MLIVMLLIEALVAQKLVDDLMLTKHTVRLAELDTISIAIYVNLTPQIIPCPV